MKLPSIFSVFLFILPIALFAQESWKLRKDRSGIQVYTRPYPGSSYKEFKGETILEAELDRLVDIVFDITAYPAWIPNAKSTKMLKKWEGGHIYYLVSDAPWPASDRDGIFKAAYVKEGNSIRLTVDCLPDHLPRKKGFVRVQESQGFWKFTPLPGGKVKVVYQLHFDPGGSIPAWLAASSVVDVPYKTLKELKVRTRTTGLSR